MRDPTGFVRAHRRTLAILAMLVLVGAGFAALEHLTREISYAALQSALRALSPERMAMAIGLTAASYLALTFYDVLALRIIGRPLPWRTAALGSFTSYTLSHNLGLGLLTGGSARYRVYTAAGLDAPDVVRVVGIASATFWIGVAAVTGTALSLHAGPLVLAGRTLGTEGVRAAGAAILLTIVGVAMLCGTGGRSVRVRHWRLPLPSAGLLLVQIGVAVLDIACASAALYVLIPGTSPALLPAFILAYTLGIVVTTVSHVPGGVGVFEAVVLAIVPGDRATLLAALIGYRILYYLLPLGVGVVLLAWHEGRRQRGRARRLIGGARDLAGGLAPPALAASCFLGGTLLLLSGSLPPIQARMGVLAHVLPLPFVEASHIAASLAGTGLMLLAPGLYRRLDGAFVATRALLVAGAAFSIAKGIDYEEASICLALAALLQWTRPAFYRRTALVRAPLSPAWMVSVAAAIALATWTGFFAYRHVDYDGQLWWRFAWNGDAPRFLRATLSVVVALIGAAVWRLLAAAPVAASRTDPAQRSRVEAIIAHRATRTDAMLALLGDKRFLLSDDGEAFLMYQVKGASWIVMGDPVGPTAAWPELLWRIRETADREQGRLLLYQISPAALDLVIGMGLSLVKYGEEAIVDLAGFTLETPALRSIRRSERSVARKGASFRIVPADEVPATLPQLKAVSDAWVTLKGHSEKGFSLGRFDPAYLARFDQAVVEMDGRIVAFANLWLTGCPGGGRQGGEASIDLMRHLPDAPSGTMDFLFARLMLWAKDAGYRRFTLGIAPLAGIEGRRLAPAWARAATLVFRHGERFYGFRGLRAYKEKYAPRWEPRYIAGTGSLAMARTMRDLARLIGRPG